MLLPFSLFNQEPSWGALEWWIKATPSIHKTAGAGQPDGWMDEWSDLISKRHIKTFHQKSRLARRRADGRGDQPRPIYMKRSSAEINPTRVKCHTWRPKKARLIGARGLRTPRGAAAPGPRAAAASQLRARVRARLQLLWGEVYNSITQAKCRQPHPAVGIDLCGVPGELAAPCAVPNFPLQVACGCNDTATTCVRPPSSRPGPRGGPRDPTAPARPARPGEGAGLCGVSASGRCGARCSSSPANTIRIWMRKWGTDSTSLDRP